MLTRTQGSSVGALSVADLAARASGDPGAPPIGTDLPAAGAKEVYRRQARDARGKI
jgi:hypothetical protein